MSALWNYACVNLRGCAPWGFQLRQTDTEPHRPVQVHQVEEGSHASLAGLCEDDELVSVNGVSCSNLSLAEVIVFIENATDCLQLVVKRCCLHPEEQSHSVNNTFQICPIKPQKETYRFTESQEKHNGKTDSNDAINTVVCTQFCIPAPKESVEPDIKVSSEVPRLEIIPGSVVELQLSLAKTTLEKNTSCTSLGSARGVEVDFNNQPNNEDDNTTTSAPGSSSFYIPLHERQPLGQRGVLVSSPSALLGQVDITLEPIGRDSETEWVEACETEDRGGKQVDYTETERGHTGQAATSFSVSFGIPSEERDSESERELNQPNKHRARHARLRRSESLSEKQVKEAKSKCKRIALLLTAAAPNPHNKGLLMFKKHRQRAKHYTLVSYGTGENEPQSDDEDNENYKEAHAVEFTVLATSETELDGDFLKNCLDHKSIVTFDCDTGLLEIERKLHNKEDMNVLPETKGKGALMFAQRKQRMDEIAAEHEDMRSKGISVESVQDAEKHYQHQPYMQANDGQNYMDVNVSHQQQHPQYQQYEDHYFHHQQQHQQQQQYQEYQQQMQYQQQHHYQQHQDYQQQLEFKQQQQYNQQQQYQQQVQQYSNNMNGMSSHQSNVMQSSVINRSAKPFSVQNTAAVTFSPSVTQEHYSDGQGEQIASRDERISVPAIKTGILQDSSRKNKSKPMFTFKEPPKVSPNPVLLNLLHKSDKKVAFDSGPEEDYLSLGAEACNFLQSPKVKDKTPPPVAPKPHINPASPPWSPEPETAEQQFPQHAENNVPVSARDSVTKIEPTAIPDQEPSSSPAPERQQALTNPPSQVQPEAVNAWGVSKPPMQSAQHTDTWHENQFQPQLQAKPEPPVSSWGLSSTQAHEQPPVSAWGPAEVSLQAQTQSQSNMQPPWATQPQVNSEVQPPTSIQTQSQPQPALVPQSQHQPQHQPQMNTWATAPTQSTHQTQWAQSQHQEEASVSTWSQEPNQPQVQPPWAQQQQVSQPSPPWTAPQQHSQPSWIQPQSQAQPWTSPTQQQVLQQPPVNTWNQPQSPVQAQPQWAQQAQPSPQLPSQMQQHQNTWSSAPSQSQSSWTQQTQEQPQQMISSWTPEQSQVPPPWTQPQSPSQTQPQWSHQPQKQAPPQSHSKTVSSGWTPRPQQGPVSNTAAAEPHKLAQQVKPWSPPQTSQTSPANRLNSYTPTSRAPAPASATSSMSRTGMGSAFEMPALKGKGAELFAKRQSRMEKYVVDSTTVQANQARPSSPTPSLPVSWKYSPNCRAPPPLSYNPLQSPSYPPGATKQPPSSSTTLKNKNKGKDKEKPAPKPLNVLDVMKHQPYQLKSSLFTYGPAAEKLAAENEAAQKLAAQQKAGAQAQPLPEAHAMASSTLVQNQDLRYDQVPGPYGFMASHQTQPPQQPYVTSTAMHDSPYHHTSDSYQPAPNVYQQVPYELHNPQHAYQQPPSSPYQQAPSLSYQQPPSYQTGPTPPYQTGPNMSYQASPTSCYQQAPSSYVIPACPVAARSDSASGSTIVAAPKPKFSAKKSDAQVWKPGTAKSADN
ncbi:synaptopodin-2 [Trichomycterus rosablanca]|uniref:synaptopodin-2 n=1 Tax=Trichomycterus rosablanca TaxID=2290929 RepID=UPI002F35FB7C